MAGNDLLVVEYVNQKRVFNRISDYKPYLFIESETESNYKTVFGQPVSRVDFDSIQEAKDFLKTYTEYQGIKVYGLSQFNYCYLNEKYPKEIKYDVDVLSIVTIDIETDSSGGFPNIEQANKEINAITLRKKGKSIVFSLYDFVPPSQSIKHIKCRSERELLIQFVENWCKPEWFPDIVTGWNCELFDIPYIVNRIKNILGMNYAKRLSPWKYLRPKVIEIGTKQYNCYDIVGISVLDYLQLYRKFSNTPQESYTLDFISEQELGEKKVDFRKQGYESLHDLCTRNPQLYLEYNVQDCALVEKMNDKLKFIELVLAIAYDAKTNFVDALTTVRLWDTIIHNHLLPKGIVIPPQNPNVEKERPIQGAYVKDPLVGMHRYCASFDFESLYPTLIEQHNISPETLVEKTKLSIYEILEETAIDKTVKAKQNNWNLTGSGCYFTNERQGFLPELMTKLKAKRKQFKNKMFEAEKRIGNGDQKAEYDYARYNALQHAIKIQLNSLYGSLANPYNRWFQPELAESITLSGQMTTMWVEKHLNKWLNQLNQTQKDYVIAADTDSCYFVLNDVIAPLNPKTKVEAIDMMDEFCRDKMQPAINKALKRLNVFTNVNKTILNMKRECLGDTGIWTSKKHYILNVFDKEGVRYDKPKPKMMGIDAIKSSTPLVCRNAVKDCIDIILNGTEPQLIAYVKQFRHQFNNMEFDQIAFPRSCNGITKYANSQTIFAKHTPVHVRASIMFNYWLYKNQLSDIIPPIEDGEKIKFCYLKEPNPFNSHSIANLSKLNDYDNYRQYIDFDLQFEKTFIGPLKSIVDVIEWSFEEPSTFTVDDFWE
jgi:DNA polymerase elongation subunit (family B)